MLTALRRDTVLFLVEKWLPIVLACVGALLQIGILYTMKKRKLRSQFPVFFNYIAFVIVGIVVNITALALGCGCNGIGAILYPALSLTLIGFEFALMYEIFVAALKPYSADRK